MSPYPLQFAKPRGRCVCDYCKGLMFERQLTPDERQQVTMEQRTRLAQEHIAAVIARTK